MCPTFLEADVKLIFVLVVLWLAQGFFFSQIDTNASAALFGALTMGLLQLSAFWYFRASLPLRAQTSVWLVPPFGVLARWTLFALVAAGSIQAVSIHFLPTLDLPFQPLTQHLSGWLVAVLIAPLVEEILFRACIFELLRLRFSNLPALLISATLFGLYHGDLVSIAFAFCGGLVFGIAYLRSNSILPGFIAHAVVNAAGLIAIRDSLG